MKENFYFKWKDFNRTELFKRLDNLNLQSDIIYISRLYIFPINYNLPDDINDIDMNESVLIGSYGFLYSDVDKDNKNMIEILFSVLLVDLLDNNAYYPQEDPIDYHGSYLIEISEYLNYAIRK